MLGVRATFFRKIRGWGRGLRRAGRYRHEPMRAFTIVNLCLWVLLLLAWIPYTAMVGFADPVSAEVRWILTVTAFLMAALFALRVHRKRPVLG